MTSKISKVHIPAGCEVLVGDSVDSLVSLGVIPEETESQIEITYEVDKIQGSKSELVVQRVRNMQAVGSSALYQYDLKKISNLCGGIMNIEETAGEETTKSDTLEAGSWAKDTFYKLSGQNNSGEKQTITSVTAGEAELTDGTDYIQMKTNDGWGILILGASTAVTSSSIVIAYTYTPTASIRATMGAGSIEVDKKIVRFLKVVNGKRFQVTMYAATMTNGITLAFPAESSDTIPSLPIEITGELDADRAEGDQLLEIIDEIGVE